MSGQNLSILLTRFSFYMKAGAAPRLRARATPDKVDKMSQIEMVALPVIMAPIPSACPQRRVGDDRTAEMSTRSVARSTDLVVTTAGLLPYWMRRASHAKLAADAVAAMNALAASKLPPIDLWDLREIMPNVDLATPELRRRIRHAGDVAAFPSAKRVHLRILPVGDVAGLPSAKQVPLVILPVVDVAAVPSANQVPLVILPVGPIADLPSAERLYPAVAWPLFGTLSLLVWRGIGNPGLRLMGMAAVRP